MDRRRAFSDGNVHPVSAKPPLTGSCAVCELPSDHKPSGVHVERLPCGHVTHQHCWQEYMDYAEPLLCPLCEMPITRRFTVAKTSSSKVTSSSNQLRNSTIPIRRNWPLIVVVGRNGTGKSTFIQYFTSQVVGCGQATTRINAYVCWSIGLGNFYLVDTPGFDDISLSLKDVFEELQRWWKKTCPKGVRVTGILYLNRCVDDTMFREPLLQLRLLRDLCCGQDPLQLTVFATLDWHVIDRPKFHELEDELNENTLKPFVNLGGQVRCLDGSMSAAERLLLCFVFVASGAELNKNPEDGFNEWPEDPDPTGARGSGDSAISSSAARSSDNTLVASTTSSTIYSTNNIASNKADSFENPEVVEAHKRLGAEDSSWIDVIPEKRNSRLSSGSVTITDTFLQQLLQQPEEKPLLRLSDRIKLHVESMIGTELIWRPLSEPRRLINRPTSWSRFTYKCVGILQYCVKRMLTVNQECGELYYLSNSMPVLRPLTIDSVKGIQFHLNGHSQPHSSSGQSVAPANPGNSSASLQSTSSNLPSGPSAPASNSNTNVLHGQSTQQSTVQPGFTGYINWCVNADPASVHLDELDVCRDVNEHSFINVLLERYKRTIGWRAKWTLYECGGVKFKKFQRLHKSDPIVSCGKEGLPDTAEYQYLRDNPFVDLEEHRAVLEDLFKHRVRHRDRHGHTELLIRTPRKTPDRVPDVAFAEGYGMHAYAVLSLERLLILLGIFSVLNLPGLGFLIHWLRSNPGDWQNASVPMTMTLALDMLLIAYVQIVGMAGSSLYIRD